MHIIFICNISHLYIYIYLYIFFFSHIILTDQARLPKAGSFESIIAGNWSDIWKAASLKRVRWNCAWHLFSHGMVSIRPATIDDLPGMQACSLTILGRSVGDIFCRSWCLEAGWARPLCVFSWPQNEKRCQHMYWEWIVLHLTSCEYMVSNEERCSRFASCSPII